MSSARPKLKDAPERLRARRGSSKVAAAGTGIYPYLLGAVLIIATLIVYFPVTSHPFLNYDDDLYVTANREVKAGLGWETVKWAFTTYDSCNWHPLTWLSHAADIQFFDLDATAHHGTNLFLHVLNVLLLYLVLWRATGSAGPSFVVAGMFALHPINVESVAWVAERKNLLSVFFFLLALGAYGWYARAPRVGRFAVVALLYVLGLMSKPQVITFPFVLLLWDYWPLRRMLAENDAAASVPQKPWTWLLLEKLPLFALSAASAVVTVQAQGASGAIRWFPFSLRLENAIVAYASYVKRACWPSNLALIYPHPEHMLAVLPVAASLLLLIAITAFVVAFRSRRYLLVGWFWFLGTLVPMIGLIQVGDQAMADRYAYLSFVGLFLMVCWGVKDWGGERQLAPRWLAIGSAAALVALAAATHHQLDYWADNVGLWAHTLQITSNNWLAENNYGGALLGEHRQEEAIEHFRRSEAIYPGDPVSHLDVGYYEQQHGDFAAALAEYEKVLALADKYKVSIAAEAYNNMGFGYLSQKEPAKARAAFQSAVQLDPLHGRAWIGLGTATQKSGDLDEAIQDFSRSVQAEPTALGYMLLAQALDLRGRTAEAQTATQEARSMSPNFAETQRTARAFIAK